MTPETFKITTSAPGKLMLFGEHSVVYGHPCIVTAIDQRTTVELTAVPQKNATLKIAAPQLLSNPLSTKISHDEIIDNLPKQIRFVYSIVRRFAKQFDQQYAIELHTHNGFSSAYGLGSSSAVTVATGLALQQLYQVPLSKTELYWLCYETVLEVQGAGSGFDIAAAIWGDTLYYSKGLEHFAQIARLPVELLTVFSGQSAKTVPLIEQVAQLRRAKPQLVDQLFNTITQVVEQAHTSLSHQHISDWGELMQLNHGLLQALGVSTAAIEQTRYQLLDKDYVSGVKISGAGGGDCVIGTLVDDQRKKVQQDTQIEVVEVRMHEQGMRIES